MNETTLTCESFGCKASLHLTDTEQSIIAPVGRSGPVELLLWQRTKRIHVLVMFSSLEMQPFAAHQPDESAVLLSNSSTAKKAHRDRDRLYELAPAGGGGGMYRTGSRLMSPSPCPSCLE